MAAYKVAQVNLAPTNLASLPQTGTASQQISDLSKSCQLCSSNCHIEQKHSAQIKLDLHSPLPQVATMTYESIICFVVHPRRQQQQLPATVAAAVDAVAIVAATPSQSQSKSESESESERSHSRCRDANPRSST
ncbi:hypothetical protein ACLKA6_018052 [Drosophila palustris]